MGVRTAWRACIAGSLVFVSIGNGVDAGVAYVGSVRGNAGNEASRWDTDSVVKSFDADGNNRYGSYSRHFYGLNNTNSAAEISKVSQTGDVVGPYNYTTVDNGSGGQQQLQTLTGSDVTNLITYQWDDTHIASIAPHGMRIGMFTDGLDGAGWTGAEYGVEHVRGGAVVGRATVTLAPDNVLDAHFFDVTGIQTGDQFRFVQGALGANGNRSATMQGYTADLIQGVAVTSSPASEVRQTSARLSGELVNVDQFATRVWLCWGDDDAGENLQLWDHKRDLGELQDSVLHEDVTNLVTDTTYYFRYHAVNSEEFDWSDVQTFTPRLPAIYVTGGQAIEGASGLTEIRFLLTLSYALDEDITLDYDLGHITTDAQDFTPVPGQVTIPAGQTTAEISVWINGDADDEIDEVFSLTFSPLAGVIVPAEPVEGVILSDDGQHLSPVDVLADASADLLYVAANGAKKIVVVDAVTERLLRNIALPDAPNGMCLNASGSRLYVAAGGSAGKIHVVDTISHQLVDSWSVGHTPMSPCLSPDGSLLYVCNRFNDSVSVLNAVSGSLLASISVKREPHAAVLSPDGGRLFVANLLAMGPSTSSQVAAHVSVIDTSSRSVSTQIALPTGSHSLRGLAMSPEGSSLYVSHILSRYYVPTTQVTRGWINTNALSIINPASEARVNTVLLDDMDEGAANPWGVKCSPDGAWLCVAHAGTHEISVIDRIAMENKLAESSDDASKDLAWMAGIRRRVALRGNGPRGIEIVSGKVFAAQYFSDSLAVAEMAGTASHGREVTIGWKKPADEIRKGEMYYNDATLCLQKWQSCASCHPDGRSDGLNWDLLNDGFGNAKNSKSHVTSWNTAPAMVTGIRADAAVGIRAGLRYIQFVNRDESYAEAIDRYFESMKPTPSPHLVEGELSEKALRGKQHFQSSGCLNCHSGPNFTNQQKYNVGTGIGSEAGKAFDVPSLVELWRSAPYLYDGRAATVRDVIETHGHGNTDGLSQQEIDELVNYLLSL